MVALPLGQGAYQRNYATEPEIQMLNRFFETNPTNTEDQTALLARPGSEILKSIPGDDLGRGFFSAPDLFDGDLFFVIGKTFYRLTPDGDLITVGGEVYGTGKPSMAFMVGAGYQYLFIADGVLLQWYQGGSKGTAVLTATGAITNQVIQIGSSYFSWASDVSGNATGKVDSPWLAKLGGSNEESLGNMVKLLMFDGTRGVDFSMNLGGQNAEVTAESDPTTMTLTSKSDLASANDIVTIVTSGADIAFNHGTLEGAGVHTLHGTEMPDGVGAKSLASLAGHVLVSVSQSGRFYWIKPGETVIDPLDFATAENQPDDILDLLAVGDTVWMLGSGSTEVWYATGNNQAPFAPTQGRTYAKGIIDGTAVVIDNQVILVGSDGIVYSIGNGLERISHHGIEERIRLQLKRELEEN